MSENTYNHLVELGGSDYEIVDGEPNIKGWTVKTSAGERLGKVDELLFEPETRKVRYLIVDMDDNDLSIPEDKKVLIPIGVATLYDNGNRQDEVGASRDPNADSIVIENDPYLDSAGYNPYNDGKVVVVPVTAQQLAWLPAYSKDSITPETETHIRQIFEGNGGALLIISEVTVPYNRADFYNHVHFNDDTFYNRTRPQ